MVLGLIIGYGIITVGFDMLPLFSAVQTPQGVTIEEYGLIYYLFTAIPIGLAIVIWLDAFMDTKILPD
jgi:hypothetical protein